jgi:hypothetical protein
VLLLDFSLAVLVLAVVKNLADGWICFWRDLHEVKAVLFGNFQGFLERFKPKLILLLVNEADGWDANLSVNPKMLADKEWKLKNTRSAKSLQDDR